MKAKRTLFICLSIAIILAVAGTVMAVGEHAAESTDSENTSLELSAMDISIDTTVLQNQTFAELSSCADSVLTMNREIVFDSNEFLRYYIASNDIELSTPLSAENSQITLNTASYSSDSQKVQYLVMLSLITEAYSDCMIPVDYNYQQSYNRMYFPILFVCPSYRTSGYDSILEYYEAIKSGTVSMPDDAYNISFYSERIENCSTGEEVEFFPKTDLEIS